MSLALYRCRRSSANLPACTRAASGPQSSRTSFFLRCRISLPIIIIGLSSYSRDAKGSEAVPRSPSRWRDVFRRWRRFCWCCARGKATGVGNTTARPTRSIYRVPFCHGGRNPVSPRLFTRQIERVGLLTLCVAMDLNFYPVVSNLLRQYPHKNYIFFPRMEMRGFEPLTSGLQNRRSPTELHPR